MLQKPHSESNPHRHSPPGDLCTDTERLFEQLSLEMELVVSGISWRGWVCVPGTQHVSPLRSLGWVPTAAPPLLVPVSHSHCLPGGGEGLGGGGARAFPASPPSSPSSSCSKFRFYCLEQF